MGIAESQVERWVLEHAYMIQLEKGVHAWASEVLWTQQDIVTEREKSSLVELVGLYIEN